ncbi:hypothetical protein NDU88_007468 [Pleurodeles waltl]|uniref:Uncharacterized protein n=1 Tax=Pleurodeles waltl TaxID=8319 RepID=A0AAV7MN13_PLEWA|nr:hypothetical protein NDU88_007468 [Pleurodeles waltl]
MTTRPVKNRINEHRSNIRCHRITTKLSTHCLAAKHSPDDLCHILEYTLKFVSGFSALDSTNMAAFRDRLQFVVPFLHTGERARVSRIGIRSCVNVAMTTDTLPGLGSLHDAPCTPTALSLRFAAHGG